MFVLRIRSSGLRAIILFGLVTFLITEGVAEGVTPVATGISKGLSVNHNFTGNTIDSVCIYDWGDTEALVKTLDDDLENPADTTYEYTNASYYSIVIICGTSNGAFTFSDEEFYVGDSITGFTVTNATTDVFVGVAPPVSSDVGIGIQYTTGTDVQLTVRVLSSGNVYNGTSIFNSPEVEYVTLSKDEFVSSVMYAIEVNAINPLNVTVSRHFVIAVEAEITGVSLSSPDQTTADTFYFLVNHDNVINTDMLSAENPVFTWWLRYESNLVDVAIEACEGVKTSNAFTIQHNSTGKFELTQVITNHINTVTTTITMYFYHAVNGFAAEMLKPIAFYDDDIFVHLEILDTTELQLMMGTVICHVDLDNGVAGFDVPFSLNDTLIYANISVKETTSSAQRLSAGYYYPTVVCSNELPNTIDGNETTQTFNLSLIVVNPVENIVLNHSSTNISYHPMTHALTITLDLSDSGDLRLDNITCNFTYDDIKSPVHTFGDLSYGSPIVADIPFSVGDKEYTIRWNCSNELSHMSDTLDVFVYYDCWNSGRYFDDVVHNSATPRMVYTNRPCTITGDVQVKVPSVCVMPLVSYFAVYIYNTFDNSETFLSNQTTDGGAATLSTITLPADTMQPNLYKIYLYTSFPDQEGSPTMSDFIFVKFTLPDLFISVVDEASADNNKQSVLKTKNVVLDSWESKDPGRNLNGVTAATRNWTCLTSPDITEDEVETYFYSGTFQSTTSSCDALLINNGQRLDIEYYSIPGIQFTVGQWYVFKLTFESGERSVSKSVAITTTEKKSIVVSLECRKGCAGAGDLLKLKGADLNADLEIPTSVNDIDISSLRYFWTFRTYNPGANTFSDVSDVISDRNASGIQIQESAIQQFANQNIRYFQLKCMVSANDHADTQIAKQFVINLAPYNGTCILVFPSGAAVGREGVKASLEQVCMECSLWKDEGNREDRSAQDEGGSLVYDVKQVFLNAYNSTDHSKPAVQLVALSNNERNCFLLSQTNETVNDLSRIDIKIIDPFETPFATAHSFVKVKPPFAIEGTIGLEGAEIVANFSKQYDEVLGGLLVSENHHGVASAVSAGAGAVAQLKGLEGETPTNVEDDGLINLLKAGTPIADPTLVEVQSVNKNLTNALKDIPVGDPALTQQVAGSLAAITQGPSVNMDDASKDNLVTIFSILSDQTENMDLTAESSTDTIGLLITGHANLGYLLVDSVSSNTETVSRELSDAKKEFSTTNDDNQELTDDTAYFIAQKKQDYVDVMKDEVIAKTKQLDEKYSKLTDSVLVKSESSLSNGVQKTYGGGDSASSISVKKNLASNFQTSPVTTSGASIYVRFSDIGQHDEVTVALSQSENVLKLDDTNRASEGKGQYKFVTKTEAAIEAFTVVLQVEPVSLTRVEPIIYPEDASQFSYHKALVTRADDMLCVMARPASDEINHYNIWVNKPSRPGVSKLDFVAKVTASITDDYSVCVLASQRGPELGSWWIGVEGKAHDENDTSTTNSSTTVAPVRKRRAATNETFNLYPAYDFGVVTTACMVWDDESNSWISSTCDGKWNITTSTLECECPPQKEITFSNSFYVAPNKIDFSSVFLKFSPLNQAAVMGTLAAVLIIYVLVIIWARRNDRKDLLKWGITPLLDNFAEDNYFYVIRVYTGMRPNSGTKSRIGMVIAGEEMDTGIREIHDGVRREFGTGSVMNFLLSTNMWLGDLEYVRLWHDNSGGGNFASWYLSKFEVQDVQRNETFIFMAEKWLSVDAEESLECVLPVAKNDNLNVFKNRFFSNAKSSLAESHIWVSVVYRPQTSNFTRTQRASCALVFVMLTMISNAMFFKSDEDPNYETPAEIQVGPFRFSLQQLYISMVCALITTTATIVVIYLFKLSRNKPQKESVLFKPRPDIKERKYKIPYVADWLDREHKKSVHLEKHLVEKGYPKFEGFYLPYWCRYIAWFLVFATFMLCGFFIMLYSMEWGKQKSEEWLTTFFLSFFESVLCMDPVKVAIMALVFAILFRAASESSTVVDRQTIMRNYAGSHRGKSGGVRLPAPPLDKERLDEERVIRLRELKMKSAFRDVLIQVFQIWILLSISFSNRDNKSYYMHKEIEESLLQPINQASFSGIKTIEQYYDWINNTVIPNAFPEDDYNGERLHWRIRQFTDGGTKFRVGPPRLRQVRVPKESCDIPYMGNVDCYGKYKTHAEDTKDYCVGWKDGPCDPNDSVYKFSADAWQFTSALDIWGLPLSGHYSTYGGGGYISKLSVNREVSHLILKELYDYSWVDRQTRAIIFEFTLYCLNVNIFTYNMFMIEFPETGGAFPFAFILPLRVYQHNGSLGKYTLACEVIFLLFLVTMTIMAIIGIYKERRAYFSQPWQMYDLIFIVAGYVAVAMYIARVVMTDYALEVFRNDKKEFVNFYHVAIWDQILVLLIGILVFLAIFRLLNILGYNKRIGAVARVFTNAAGDLLWFGLFFFTIFTCYAVFGFLLFGSKLSTYKNVYRTMGTLFISMIGKSRFTEIEDTDPIMSKLYFMVFIFFVVYMILTMFLAILSQSIDKVHEESKNDKGDEMIDYLMKKFRRVLGYGQGTDEDRRHHNRNLAMYSAQPAAPWNMKKGRKFEYDNRQILEDIRMSLTDAMMMNMDPKEFSTPVPDKRESKKLRH